MSELNKKPIPPSSCICGSFGCVIFPSAKCISCNTSTPETVELCESDSEAKYITKLFFNKNSMDNEIEKYKELKLEYIDPDMKFFISKPIVCDSLTLDNIREKVSKCKDKTKLNGDLFGINFIYGGENLKTLYFDRGIPRQPKTIEEYKILLLALKNVFEGVKLLHSKHIYHMDLKLENIVIDFNQPESTNPICKIIDFGETINLDSDLKNELKDYIGTPYYTAPEMALDSYDEWRRMFGTPDLQKNNSIKSSIEYDIIVKLEDYISKNDIFGFLSNFKLNIDKIPENSQIKYLFDKNKIMDNTFTNLSEYVIGILKDKSKDKTEDFYNKYIKYIKGDIWALGIILLIFHSLINTDIQEDNSQKKPILDNLFRVIDNLLTINPYERLNADQALELYNTFLTFIQQPDIVGGFINKKTKKTKYTKNTKKSKKSNKLNKSKIHKTYKRNRTNKGGFLGKSRAKSSFLGKSRTKNNLR